MLSHYKSESRANDLIFKKVKKWPFEETTPDKIFLASLPFQFFTWGEKFNFFKKHESYNFNKNRDKIRDPRILAEYSD